ncbi:MULTISPECIES: helix-turn-helix domain-containing protein [Nocardiopsidaceae]|uniref:Helix-turn-helix transcriptional regulator n=2 Tax=Nocardiopsidaceae TaxID=83676 RepID=A0ABY6YHI0_9ACTN|nr:helix-turn-helix transcriptional regulator [Streptomonospora nanhaiensis]MEE2042168.1 helix-turn-helix transcriptional regulator [Nocardiopsis tropica]WAE71730.1 helix-turn-helix transcriptional regulator [Streptomonospora nanhaiensis]
MALEPEELAAARDDLGAELRELRRAAGLSGDRLARRCSISQSKISKIETGRLTPTLVDLDRILTALGATAEQAARVLQRAKLANTEWQDKRTLWRKGLETRQSELKVLESAASEIRFFLPTMVTGLLATPAYIKASLTHSPGDVSSTVAKKIDRQAILREGTRSFTFLLTEQAVRWAILPPGGMAAQRERLLEVSRWQNVRLGVIPLGVLLPRGPMNTFTVYDDRLATVEIFTGRLAFRDARDVKAYRELFAMYEEHALFGDTGRDQIRAWGRS